MHWGTPSRRPIRDDQEAGGRVVFQTGYRVRGTVTVPLCPQCYATRLLPAAAASVIRLLGIVGAIGGMVSALLWPALPSSVTLLPSVLVAFAAVFALEAVRRSGWAEAGSSRLQPDAQAGEVAQAHGLIPSGTSPLTPHELTKLGPPDPDGVRWPLV